MAVPMASVAKGVTFGGFRRRRASFHLAGVALCDIPTCFRTCRKSFCVAGVTFCDVFRRCVAFFVAGATHGHFAWQAQHFRRVMLRAFANRIVRAASSGDKVQIAWQVWHFVRCAEH